MAQPKLSQEKIDLIEKFRIQGHSTEDVARFAGVGHGTAAKYIRQNGMAKGEKGQPEEPEFHDAIRRILKKGPQSDIDLADLMDCSPRRIRAAIDEMKIRGVMLLEQHGKIDLAQGIDLPPGSLTIPKSVGSGTRSFGVTGDNHLSNRHSRLDVLNAAYDEFAERGITEVFNTGNWIDGEAKFNKTELVTAPGLDNQINYMIDKYPQREGIVTHYIAGDDHEGWYFQREGIEVGRYLQTQAERQGRTDLKYMGYGEADVKLEHGTGSICMRVVHPGGGSSYATSYTSQKRVESYSGGEKPQIELAGHYHKFQYGYPREVHCVDTGCTCDQTMFMRKKKLQAHVGFIIVNITQNSEGILTRFNVEWFPFYDRKFYEKRF